MVLFQVCPNQWQLRRKAHKRLRNNALLCVKYMWDSKLAPASTMDSRIREIISHVWAAAAPRVAAAAPRLAAAATWCAECSVVPSRPPQSPSSTPFSFLFFFSLSSHQSCPTETYRLWTFFHLSIFYWHKQFRRSERGLLVKIYTSLWLKDSSIFWSIFGWIQ